MREALWYRKRPDEEALEESQQSVSQYRPRLFEELAGQEAVSVTLTNAVETGRVSQAYLFFGPKGVGKTTTARILSKALNCAKGSTPKPCGECPSCIEIAAGTSIDVLELDAASHTQVEKIREMIIETVSLAPSRDRHKVFIIDEVHMLSPSSFNALLKTLEEPPPHVVFILATTELTKIPATIVSRCQRFRFRPLSRETIMEFLQGLAKTEKIKAAPKALERIAKAAGGSLRDAVSLLDQAAAYCEGEITREKLDELMGLLPEELVSGAVSAVLGKDAKALAGWIEKIAAQGHDPLQLLKDLRERFEELYLQRLGVLAADEEGKALSGPHAAETFSFLVQRINKVLEDLRSSDTPQVTFEMGLFGMLESAYDLGTWVARLEALEKRIASGGAAAPVPPPAPVVETRAKPEPKPAPIPPMGNAPSVDRVPARAAPSADAGELWRSFLERVHRTRPTLEGILSKARLAATGTGEWTITFETSFFLDRAKEEEQLISTEFSAAAGGPARLRLELAAGKEGSEGWVDAAESGGASEDAGVRRVLDIFPGEIKPVRKKGH